MIARDDLDLHIGRRIRELRLARSVSMEDLAATLELSYQQVQKYERGINRVSAARLFIIAQALGVDLTSFFPASGEEKQLPDIVRLMNSLDPPTRAQVTALIETLASRT